MKKNQKMVMSAAALAMLAGSVSGACSAQSAPLSQTATDAAEGVDTLATAATESAAGDSSPSGATYVDGEYTGTAASTRWGDVQVSVVIANGSIADIQFLQYPDEDARSAQINAEATVTLVQEAIQNQSSSVQVISGATFTSEAFMQSLEAALAQAG